MRVGLQDYLLVGHAADQTEVKIQLAQQGQSYKALRLAHLDGLIHIFFYHLSASTLCRVSARIMKCQSFLPSQSSSGFWPYPLSPGAKTINVFRACLGAQLTICAQK